MKTKHIVSLMTQGYTTVSVCLGDVDAPRDTTSTGFTNRGSTHKSIGTPPPYAPAAPIAPPPPSTHSLKQAMPTTYTYKMLYGAGKVNDRVVVDTPHGLIVGTIHKVDATPQIDLDGDYDYRWIVSVIDMKPYLEQIAKEDEFNLKLMEIERNRQREEVKKQFLALNGLDEAGEELASAIENLNK